jgi:thiol-disulfide isomerase/thioredoxin
MGERVLLCLFACLLTAVYGKPWYADTKATDITSKNKDTILGGDKYVFIDFYTPPCHWCQVFAPTFEQIAEYYTETDSEGYRDDIVIARING